MSYKKKIEGTSERLDKAILESKLTISQISERTGIARSTTYGHLEGKAMSELHVARYCMILGVSADWLLGLKE